MIGNKSDTDFAGAKYGQQLCCKNCGSLNVAVFSPYIKDQEKGCEIPYRCKDCGYEGARVARVKDISDDGVLTVDLIPDGLVGLPNGYGNMAYGNY